MSREEIKIYVKAGTRARLHDLAKQAGYNSLSAWIVAVLEDKTSQELSPGSWGIKDSKQARKNAKGKP
jgi:hypothetical protein